MAIKQERTRGYMVYTWVAVNVKVKASSAKRAKILALSALTEHGLENLTHDDSRPIYLDECLNKIDKKQPDVLSYRKKRVYAREE